MMAKIKRTYEFSQDDIRTALCEYLRKRDRPTPKYIGNTPCTARYVRAVTLEIGR